ncbi:hypothetical protein JZ751_018629 [Albula glossodonta]|uniref:Uncharacterized protein n=1 Tax=Albula glossodonta TaxID=121402 RepID=A0A8T2MTC8_9TELE|nr:hypothetical protein JZ751_018629 [Albula glossodonta]
MNVGVRDVVRAWPEEETANDVTAFDSSPIESYVPWHIQQTGDSLIFFPKVFSIPETIRTAVIRKAAKASPLHLIGTALTNTFTIMVSTGLQGPRKPLSER